MTGPRHAHDQDHDVVEARAAVLRPGLPARVGLQPRRSDARVPQGAAARSAVRDVLLGRSVGARTEHQRADGRRKRTRRRSPRSRSARRLAPRASQREQALIDALAARYSRRCEGRSRRARRRLRRRDAQGREALSQRPRDRDAVCRRAHERLAVGLLGARRQEAACAASPTSCRRSSACSRRIPIMRLRSISTSTRWKRPTNPKRAERYADRLAKLAPGAGHLVHMPSHIYFVARPLQGFARGEREGGESGRSVHRGAETRRASIRSATTRTTCTS